MINIQKLNYTCVPNEIIDKMSELTDIELRMMLAICRKTIGYHKETDQISHSQLVGMTGLTTNAIKKARKMLVEKRLLKYEILGKGKNTRTIYDLNVSPNDPLENNMSPDDIFEQGNVSPDDIKPSSNISPGDTTKESNINKLSLNKEEYCSYGDHQYPISIVVILILNEKTGKHFKPNTQSTNRLINARLKEGYGIDDFKKVIDVKVSHWLNDPKMDQYLRPETLFGTKFGSYLNQKPNLKNKIAKSEDTEEWQRKNQERNNDLFSGCEPVSDEEFAKMEKYG